MEGRALLLIFIAVILDAVDLIGGFIPGIGDILDIVGPFILYSISKDPMLLGGLVELIPLVDFLPTNLALALAHVYEQVHED